MKQHYETIPIAKIVTTGKGTPRQTNRKLLADLISSIKAKGILEPLLVCPNPKRKGTFLLMAGRRRLHAAEFAGLKVVPASVRDVTEQEFLEIQIIENLQREDIAPLEEARSFVTLLEAGVSVDDVAAKVGKPVSYIVQRTKLVDLLPAAMTALDAGALPLGHALVIARLQPPDQKRAFQFALKTWQAYDGEFAFSNNNNPSDEVEEERDPKSAGLYGLTADTRTVCSLADLRDFIQMRIVLSLADAPFDTSEPILVKSAGACTVCPKRTGAARDLFPDVHERDTCTDAACFQRKLEANLVLLRDGLIASKKKHVEITADGIKPKGHPHSITPRSYKVVGKRDTCKYTRVGIYVDQMTLGHTALICRAKKECRKHFGKEIAFAKKFRRETTLRDKQPSWEERQAAREARLDKARLQYIPLLRAMLEATPTKLVPNAEERLAELLWPEIAEQIDGLSEARQGRDMTPVQIINLWLYCSRRDVGMSYEGRIRKDTYKLANELGVDGPAIEAARRKVTIEKGDERPHDA